MSSMPSFKSDEESSTEQLLERPKRPCTAYNFFFQDEREKLLSTLPVRAKGKPKGGSHGKIGFNDLAKVIAGKWKTITSERMIHYANLANADKLRYRQQMFEYKQQQRELQARQEKETLDSMQQVVAAQQQQQAVVISHSTPKIEGSKPTTVFSALSMSANTSKRGFRLNLPQYSTAASFPPSTYSDVTTSTTTMAFLLPSPPPSPMSVGPSIADLANQLDQESIDLIVRIFK